MVQELRALLRARQLPPPYVLVGHSLGGLYMQLYARQYPAEVAALQQQTADLFYENRLVPKKVDIRQRIWQPTQLEGKQL